VQAVDGGEGAHDVFLVKSQRSDHGFAVRTCRRCDIEDVARLDARAAIVNFLRDDLGNGFRIDRLALDRFSFDRRRRPVIEGVVLADPTMKSISPIPAKASLRKRAPSP
jgi:hypothetical protein